MSILQRLNMMGRMALLVAVPLFTCCAFGGYILFDNWRSMETTASVAATAEFGPVLGAFVHEAQIERGLSVSLLQHSGGDGLAEAREKQIARVDATAAALRQAIALQGAGQDAGDLAKALEDIGGLKNLRAAVQSGAIGADDAQSRYSAIIQSAIAPVENLTRSAELSDSARAIIAYASLLRAKEAAGMERATGARAFSRDGFDRTVFPRLVSLGAAQSDFLAMARLYSSAAGAVGIDAFLASPAEAALRDLRQKAEAAALRGGGGVDSAEWFSAASTRIDAMKTLEEALSRQLTERVYAAAGRSRQDLVLAALLVVAVVAAAAFAARRVTLSITRPITALTSCMTGLARGDHSCGLSDVDAARRDEIGAMVRAVSVFRETAIERDRLDESARAERQKELSRQAILSDSIKSFRAMIGDVAADVAREAATMHEMARNLSDAAGRAAEAGQEANDEARGSAQNVQTVSAAAVELSASINEVSSQMRCANQKIGQAAEAARNTDARVTGLQDAAERIGAIVEMIRGIAQQTNMLALNATIEAARAGEAGKGFAVVAAEVKGLAAHTAKATDEIATQIAEIQRASHGAAEDIRRIVGAVDEIDRTTGLVSGSVEQQSAATGEIASAISAAWQSAERSTQSVDRMAEIIAGASHEAAQVAGTSGLLTDSSHKLSDAVAEFLRSMNKEVQERRIALRKASKQGVILLDGGPSIATRLIDISETGAKIVAPEILRDRQNLGLEFEDGARVRAQVVWIADGFAGLQFAEPLAPAEPLAA